VTEHAEGTEGPNPQPAEVAEAPIEVPTGSTSPEMAAPPPYVFALGRVAPRFPTLALEKEFEQATGRLEDTAGLTDR
jgi:hypothetical protein